MRRHPDVAVRDDGHGYWSVLLRGTAVRTGVSREEADVFSSATPSELVKGTRWARDWFNRGFAAERIAGVSPTYVCDPIKSGGYVLDLFDLYDRMWDIAEPEAAVTRSTDLGPAVVRH